MEEGGHVQVLGQRERFVGLIFVVEHQLSSLDHRRVDHPERHVPAASRVRRFLELLQLRLFDGHLLRVELGEHLVANSLQLLVVGQRFKQRVERASVYRKSFRISCFDVALNGFDFSVFILIFQVDRSDVSWYAVETATANDVETF